MNYIGIPHVFFFFFTIKDCVHLVHVNNNYYGCSAPLWKILGVFKHLQPPPPSCAYVPSQSGWWSDVHTCWCLNYQHEVDSDILNYAESIYGMKPSLCSPTFESYSLPTLVFSNKFSPLLSYLGLCNLHEIDDEGVDSHTAVRPDRSPFFFMPFSMLELYTISPKCDYKVNNSKENCQKVKPLS